MSSIFEIWNINGEPVEEKYLRKMEEKLRQYGRDWILLVTLPDFYSSKKAKSP